MPEAYITATRQYVAQANSISLEELSLSVKVLSEGAAQATVDGNSFAAAGWCCSVCVAMVQARLRGSRGEVTLVLALGRRVIVSFCAAFFFIEIRHSTLAVVFE